MKNKKIWLVLLVLPLLVASYAFAQGIPTGTLSGNVGDEGGVGLPGVSVTATSPALQGSRTTVTNVNGDWVMPNLPPGEYTVTIALSGFQTVKESRKLSSGQEVPIKTKLSMAGVSTVVTVAAQSESVSQTSAATTTLSADILDKLPVTRTMLSAVVLSPGVNTNGANGAVTIAGASSWDSVFTVNGTNVQDNVRGTPTNLFIEDAIQETSTMTSSVSAEYGHFTGGVINAITKRGGNTFSGSFRVTENNDNTKAQTPIHTVYADHWIPTYEGTLGGPIWTDKIWFFLAARNNNQQTSAATVPIVEGGPSQSFPQGNLNDRYEGKLTISPVPNHTLTGDYTWTTTHSDNYYFTPLPILDTNVIYNRRTPSDLIAFQYNGVITSDFFLEASYSKKKFTFVNSGGTDTSLIGGTSTMVLDQGKGQMYSPIFCGVCSPESRDNRDITAKGTYFLSSSSLGTHNISAGYQNFQQARLSNNYQSGSNWAFYPSSVVQTADGKLYPVVDSNSYFIYYPIPKLSQGSDLLTNSVFVNDAWKLNNNLSFNLGVRWDKNNAKDSGGHLVADDSQYSPRLSASYDIKGDGKFRVSASYARYVGQIQETTAGTGGTSAGNPASYYYFWNKPGQNPINSACPPACTPTDQILQQMFTNLGVTGVGMFANIPADIVTLPGVNQQIISPLKSPNANEYALGFGGQVGSNFVYRVDAVRREFKDFYALSRNLDTGFVSDDLGNPYNLGVLVNTNIAKRAYTALNTSLSYRWSALTVGGNWTWSHTIGNFTGESSGGGPTLFAGINYPEYVQASWNYPSGSLLQDQRHRIRLYASYDARLGPVTITPGVIQAIDTGTPYGASGTINSSPYVASNLACSSATADPNRCYLTPPTSVTYYFTSRDAYRTPTIYQTDLSLNISGKVGPIEIFIQPQVRNVFNGQAVTFINNTTGVNTSVSTGKGLTPNATTGLVRFNPFTTAPIECPQGDSKADCIALGANWQKSANFGKPTSGSSAAPSFQIPRQYLVTVGARF